MKIIYVLVAVLAAIFIMHAIGSIMAWVFELILVAIFATGFYFLIKWYLKRRKK